MSYNSKYKGAEVESLLDKVNDMGEIPTKVSQLENDVPYATEDVASDGVYAVDASGKLIDYNTADSSCLGVALVAGEHKFMIAKSNATDDTNTTLYWSKNLYKNDVAGITNISSGADYIGEGKKYSCHHRRIHRTWCIHGCKRHVYGPQYLQCFGQLQ